MRLWLCSVPSRCSFGRRRLNMFTPLREAGISYLLNESAVSAVLASSIGHRCGLYAFPTGGLTKESSGGSPLCGTRPLACVNCSPAAAALWR